jgi:hypothetical protein
MNEPAGAREAVRARLLYRLCVELGFCLPPADRERLERQGPEDVVAFADAVYRAEGLDPLTADLHLYRQVKQMIADAFREFIDRAF